MCLAVVNTSGGAIASLFHSLRKSCANERVNGLDSRDGFAEATWRELELDLDSSFVYVDSAIR